MLNQSQIIKTQELVQLLSISTTTLWRLRKENRFPEPIKLTERLIGWKIETIENWINDNAPNTNTNRL